MGRMDRVKEHLLNTVHKFSAAIEKSHAEGKIPNDYSLGFINACIFFEHQLSMREGAPKFFDRTTSVGVLPMPIALKGDEVEKEYNSVAARARSQELDFYKEQALTQVRGVLNTMECMREHESRAPGQEDPQLIKDFSLGLAAIRKAMMELDEILAKHEEMNHAHEKQSAVQQEAKEGEQTSVSAPLDCSTEQAQSAIVSQ